MTKWVFSHTEKADVLSTIQKNSEVKYQIYDEVYLCEDTWITRTAQASSTKVERSSVGGTEHNDPSCVAFPIIGDVRVSSSANSKNLILEVMYHTNQFSSEDMNNTNTTKMKHDESVTPGHFDSTAEETSNRKRQRKQLFPSQEIPELIAKAHYSSERADNKKLDRFLSEKNVESRNPVVMESHRCLICLRSFSKSNNLENHIKLTHYRNPLPDQLELKSRKSEQTEERRFKCTLCKNSFCRPLHRDRHLLTHTEEREMKRHKCSSCSKSFHRSDHLKNHVRIHTGERPYECSRCLKTFAQSHTLKGHLKTHTDGKLNERANRDTET